MLRAKISSNMLRAKISFAIHPRSIPQFPFFFMCVCACHFFLVYTKGIYAGAEYEYILCTYSHPPPLKLTSPAPPLTHTADLHVKKHARVFRRGSVRQ